MKPGNGMPYDFPTRDPAVGGTHAVKVNHERLVGSIGDHTDAAKGHSGALGTGGHSSSFHFDREGAELVVKPALFSGFLNDAILRQNETRDTCYLTINIDAIKALVGCQIEYLRSYHDFPY
jgi:hypothetical protein